MFDLNSVGLAMPWHLSRHTLSVCDGGFPESRDAIGAAADAAILLQPVASDFKLCLASSDCRSGAREILIHWPQLF